MLVTNLANSSLILASAGVLAQIPNRPTVSILRSWDIPRSKESFFEWKTRTQDMLRPKS